MGSPDGRELQRRDVFTTMVNKAFVYDMTIMMAMMIVFRYVNHDGSPSFKDFSPFGGWTEPAIKQYDQGDRGHFDYGY
jgi:hypothetical protein